MYNRNTNDNKLIKKIDEILNDFKDFEQTYVKQVLPGVQQVPPRVNQVLPIMECCTNVKYVGWPVHIPASFFDGVRQILKRTRAVGVLD